MAVKNNPVLGEVECSGCGGNATVHQTQRGKGRFLYTRCTECGPDQRAGKAVQQRLWNETRWREGQRPEAPPNVNQQGSADDWKPPVKAEKTEEPTESQSVKQPPAKPKKSGRGLIVLGVVGLMIGGVALALKKKPKQKPQMMGEYHAI